MNGRIYYLDKITGECVERGVLGNNNSSFDKWLHLFYAFGTEMQQFYPFLLCEVQWLTYNVQFFIV